MDTVDQRDRRLAIHERERNVIVDASAGTGKTSLVVERLLELVAPGSDAPPIPIERIVAITFTRKAAGELRVRTRQRILEQLATLPSGNGRVEPLRRALGAIDTAEIGTIHSFADRLLRRWPAQAHLDPRYALDEEPDILVAECFDALLHAADTGGLRELVRGSPAEERADEATATIHDVRRAGIQLRSRDSEFWTYHGLDGLVAELVRQRDVGFLEPDAPEFDRRAFERHADELARWVGGLSTATRGGRWLVDAAALVHGMLDDPDPAILYRELAPRLQGGPRGRKASETTKRDDFANDTRAWDAWKAFDGDTRTKHRVRDRPLRDDLLAPLRRWFAHRLVRLHPVVMRVYEVVKAKHRAVDHVDLLLRLRDLLRDDLGIRHGCQQLFDHIFVDEFQDTDPLQAEVILYLCERGPTAGAWTDVVPAPGTLTIVGDPKQSIYRFRRADIAAYQRVVDMVERAPHLSVRLASSWRSTPSLVDWFNDRFETVLGRSREGERFSSESGEVAHAVLAHGRAASPDVIGHAVHALAIDPGEPGGVDAQRTLEADAMARYVRWLVEVSGLRIADRFTGAARPVAYGDVGVLAISTTNLRVLFDAFDRDRVPYAARGGTLFLADRLHRHFLLGLAALADRDDGVAAAALLRPPFFAIDLADLSRACPGNSDDRATRAKEIVRELRRRRFDRSVGATARALLDETGFGRTVALGPNGVQRLRGLRELCLQLEVRALDEQLDFDAAVERVRDWIYTPRQLERPHPVTRDVVRVMTVHQAKGLEFPVVVLWDACATWRERGADNAAWIADRDGSGWSLALHDLRWDEPAGLAIAKRERRMREAERKRLVYVAATRARDLLVVPRLGPLEQAPDNRTILGALLGAREHASVRVTPLHTPASPAAWYLAASPPAEPAVATTARDVELRERWRSRAALSCCDRLRPMAFTDARSPRLLWGKKGRFGTLFGTTVHEAIGRALAGVSPDDAVARAAANTGLQLHLDEAVADVVRAVTALAGLGITTLDHQLRLEYPIAGVAGTNLAAGYVDLVAIIESGPVILDFKTDVAPGPSDPLPAAYVEQVLGYVNVLASGLGVTNLRSGLLFTSDGSIRWLSSISDGGR